MKWECSKHLFQNLTDLVDKTQRPKELENTVNKLDSETHITWYRSKAEHTQSMLLSMKLSKVNHEGGIWKLLNVEIYWPHFPIISW